MILDSTTGKIQLRQVLGTRWGRNVSTGPGFVPFLLPFLFPAEAVQLVPGLYFSARRRVGCRED